MASGNDFSKGSMRGNILRLAGPMTLAQLVHLLYNIVDRMYIGHLPKNSTLALTGLGLTFPIITIITAFSNLFSTGSAALFSIARGEGDEERAERLMGMSFTMLISAGIVLMILCLLIKQPILYLFGASDDTFPYADQYLEIYLLGTVFVTVCMGMNYFINAQGMARKGMLTVMLGAVLNLVLDPIFIFVFNMGVRGAALATILSQGASSLWVFRVLIGKQCPIRLRKRSMGVHWSLLKESIALGTPGFVMSVTNSGVQVVCNATLQQFGGDIYVGIMTVINSIREVVTTPTSTLTAASEPVLGYNYGAKEYGRVRQGIRFMSLFCIIYTTVIWILLLLFPEFFIHIFNSDPQLIELGVPMMGIYFFGFFMMSLQFSGQSVFVSQGKAKFAIFFSILRKGIIVIPLTLILPHIGGLGVRGVFLAEPISNFIGGSACYITMLCTVWRKLKTPVQERGLSR